MVGWTQAQMRCCSSGVCCSSQCSCWSVIVHHVADSFDSTPASATECSLCLSARMSRACRILQQVHRFPGHCKLDCTDFTLQCGDAQWLDFLPVAIVMILVGHSTMLFWLSCVVSSFASVSCLLSYSMISVVLTDHRLLHLDHHSHRALVSADLPNRRAIVFLHSPKAKSTPSEKSFYAPRDRVWCSIDFGCHLARRFLYEAYNLDVFMWELVDMV